MAEPRTILIVEDSRSLAHTCKLQLEAGGHVPLAEMERLYIERAIGLHDGNIPLAARKLGISPSTIYRKKEGWT